MKNEKILLITLILILQSIPSFSSSLNGKGIICKEYERSYYELPFEGFLFEDNMLVHYQFIQLKNDIIIDPTWFIFDSVNKKIIFDQVPSNFTGNYKIYIDILDNKDNVRFLEVIDVLIKKI